MRDHPQAPLGRAARELANAAVLPPPVAVRARGDRRRRRKAAGSAVLAVALLAGGGTAFLALGRQQPAAPPTHQPTQAPTGAPSQHPTHAPSGRPTHTPAAMLPAGRVGPRSAVPWPLVGPGWTLAEYTRTGVPGAAAPSPQPTVLYLVDPVGGRYQMYRWPASRAGARPLIDWSGDRARALFWSWDGPGRPNVVRQLVLATGAVTSFTLPAGVSPVGYTRPDGTNLLAINGVIAGGQGREEVLRFDLTGGLRATTLATGYHLSAPVSSPDGTTLAIGDRTGIELVSNGGGSPRRLPIPGANSSVGCHPVRWWNSGTVLAACMPASSGAQQLWLAPADGSRPAALTPVRAGGMDLGDADAWKLPSGLYLQAEGAGCSTFIARQAADGSVTPVSGQGSGVNTVLAVVGSRMLVRAGYGCPSSGSLIWLDPATGAVRTLLAAPVSERGVTQAVAYSGPGS